jgi:hypothetical protein
MQAQGGDSYLGAWQPPTIYQSNTFYDKQASFSGPAGATITTIYWQLEWTPNDGVPSGLEMVICDASFHCTTITNLTTNGNTGYFAGESATQTFTFEFKIPTAKTTTYNPPYTGIAANSWLTEYYND